MSIVPVRAARITDTTLKNTVFLHFSIFAAAHFSMRAKPCKAQCFLYLAHTHTRNTVNYMVGGEPGVNRGWVGGGRRQGASLHNLRFHRPDPYLEQGRQRPRGPCQDAKRGVPTLCVHVPFLPTRCREHSNHGTGQPQPYLRQKIFVWPTASWQGKSTDTHARVAAQRSFRLLRVDAFKRSAKCQQGSLAKANARCRTPKQNLVWPQPDTLARRSERRRRLATAKRPGPEV